MPLFGHKQVEKQRPKVPSRIMGTALAMNDNQAIWDILSSNATKNFVQRIMAPGVHPVIHLPDGTIGTHLMADAETDGKYIVYPTIVQPKGERDLRRLEDDEALQYALTNNEYITFPSQQDASWFAQNYKSVWPKGWK